MTWDTDPQYTEEKLSDVTPGEEGWTLEMSGSGIFCPKDQCTQAPSVGETVRVYGKGLGYPVRGILIEGRVYSYRTEEQEASRHAEWVAEESRQKQARLERERADRDARRLALPPAFRERLATYEARNPIWRRDFESYELFVCEQATRLVQRFGADLAALEAFDKLPASEQKAQAPELKLSEHSGNTWGAAVGLAHRFMCGPGNVKGAHGALCGLVGCRDYGCPGADVAKERS